MDSIAKRRPEGARPMTWKRDSLVPSPTVWTRVPSGRRVRESPSPSYDILLRMEQAIRVITWNCRKASTNSKLWDYLLELDPDVALLQDFIAIPERVLQVYDHAQNAAADENRSVPCFMSGVLVKGNLTEEIPLPAPPEHSWVERELENFKEFFTAKWVTLQNGISLKVLSVYSPAFPIDRTRLKGIDTTGIQLTQNSDVWVTELLYATLKSMRITPEDLFIVGGDLNSSETFDYLWRGGPRG